MGRAICLARPSPAGPEIAATTICPIPQAAEQCLKCSNESLRLDPNSKTLPLSQEGFDFLLKPLKAHARTTLEACNPFGPVIRSYSTVSPSFKVR